MVGRVMMKSCAMVVWAIALGSLAAGCASSGATVAGHPVPKPFPMPPGEARTPIQAEGQTPNSIDAYALVGTALQLRGTQYRDGGADPKGFDCSGFTQYVFRQHGLSLPRAVREQFSVGTPVAPDAIEAGDLLFFTTGAPGPSHVAIAVDSDEFVHAPSSVGVVRVERLSARYWAQRFVGARRLM
jgi:cell wall-associated NlpC family hydrolase